MASPLHRFVGASALVALSIKSLRHESNVGTVSQTKN